MKIKYKLIIILMIVIICASLPVSLFILNKQEQEKIDLIKHYGYVQSIIMARSTVNTLLMNAGDILSTRVDLKELNDVFRYNFKDGLVYADSILMSTRKSRNGMILSSFINEKLLKTTLYKGQRVPERELLYLSVQGRYVEKYMPLIGDDCFIFMAKGYTRGNQPVCISRLIYSKSIILKPIKDLRVIIYQTIGFAMLVVSIFGIILSRFITKPIGDLIKGINAIEDGHFDTKVPVKSRDEIGRFSNTFNHMLQMLNLEITELINANRELSRLNKLKDEFLANTSHELRSPLYGIIGLAESLVEGTAGDLPDDALHDLNLIIKSGRRLSGLVNDILDYEKLKHHDIDLDLTAVDMHSIIQYVCSIMHPLIEQKSLYIINEVPYDKVWVTGDENRLQQVVINLINNAIKFTQEGGITITYEKNTVAENEIIIIISDTGIGIPEDSIGRIFNSFEQVDSSETRSYGGTGLGLTITRKIIEMHKGSIWVKSEVGRGSRFFISLPVSEKPSYSVAVLRESNPLVSEIESIELPVVREQKTISRTKLKINGQRVLVVDDETINLQVLTNHLTLDGYIVDTAMSGQEALEKLSGSNKYDIVLLDVMLPRISGYDVCRIIRETFSIYELPILMLTAKNKSEDLIQGLEAGANDYLVKPVNRTELLARVKSHVTLKESVRMNNELSIIRRDIFLAHELQHSLLPAKIDKNPFCSLAVRYLPMNKLGGDLYDVQFISDDKMVVIIADVSGHGISAAFISAMLKVTWSFHKEFYSKPDIFLYEVNNTMMDFAQGQFITLNLAFIDFSANKLYQANAGNWPLLLLKKNGEIFQDYNNGLPIGVSKNEVYELSEFDIGEGDRVVLYTDGIIEARNQDGKMFMDSNLKKTIMNGHEYSCEDIADHILDETRKWVNIQKDVSFDDDVTLIVFDINEKLIAN